MDPITIATTVIGLLQILAKEAPQAQKVILELFQKGDPTPEQIEEARARVKALTLDDVEEPKE